MNIMNKTKRRFWGILFILSAIFIVLQATHVIHTGINIWNLILLLVFGAYTIKSYWSRSWIAGSISLALTATVAKTIWLLPIPSSAIWLSALCLAIGLQLVFKGTTHFKISSDWVNDMKSHAEPLEGEFSKEDDGADDDSDDTADDNQNDQRRIEVVANLSDHSRYLHSSQLEQVDLKASISDLSLYFDDVTPADHTITLNITSSMSDISLYIPRGWVVNDQSNHTFSDISETRHPGQANDTTTLIIRGNLTMSNLSIKYI